MCRLLGDLLISEIDLWSLWSLLLKLLHIVEAELAQLDMKINANKSHCIRIGPRQAHNFTCADIITSIQSTPETSIILSAINVSPPCREQERMIFPFLSLLRTLTCGHVSSPHNTWAEVLELAFCNPPSVTWQRRPSWHPERSQRLLHKGNRLSSNHNTNLAP